ncbi:MAG: sodium:alanine symporter family protein [Planctomycetes bacterium]|nr:sodium:alanine symporter family protein [Planctomycetota bacterium]
MLLLLFGTHVFLTVRLGFIQRFLGRGIRISVSRKSEGQGDISQFGALTTALAATIGTGNIVGVATAVAAGGPGAVLWMWLTGVFGIATKYAEALLSVHYRITTASGQMAGGPMYVLERGLRQRWLGLVFAALTAVAAFGLGNMVQSNSISCLVAETAGLGSEHPLGRVILGAPAIRWATGAAITGLTALVILGGIRWIARVCEVLVPFMAIFYVAGCAVILAMRYETIPETLALICRSALTGHAAVGGFMGAGMKEAVRYGIARGLFSNESGLGSAPIVAAAAQTSDPVRQALVSSTGTFWDTVVVCAITGTVIVNTGLWREGLQAAALTKATFEQIPGVGPAVLVVGLMTFVFSTILGWSYYGEKAAEYLFGSGAVRYYRYLWVAAVMVGSVTTLKAVWSFADLANACMAVPNLVSLIALSGTAASLTRRYLGDK